MRSTMILAVLSLAMLAPACPPPPTPSPPPAPDAGPAPPPPVDGGATVYDQACAAIAAAGCTEGRDPTCAATLQHIDGAHITPLDVQKCAAAKTKADVRACGSIRCP